VRGPGGPGPVVVADGHAVAAAAAASQQPGQQRRAVPGRARRGRGLPVGGHPADVRLVLLLGDIGRQPARQQHRPLAAVHDHPAGAGPAVRLAARLDLAAPVGVVPGVDRVVQHELQRLPGRAPPLELSLRRPRVNADRQLDALRDQIAEHAVERAQPPERAEDQPDDVLRLLVRVEGGLAGRAGSASSTPDREHSSSSWCQSRPVRASRDISMPSTMPARPMVTSVTSLAKPFRESAVAADTPRSSSITTTCDRAQPRAAARRARTAAVWTRNGQSPAACSTGGRTRSQAGRGAPGGSPAAAAPAAGTCPGPSRPPLAALTASIASIAGSAATAARRSGGSAAHTTGPGVTACRALSRIWLTCCR
jgi:hypothetical protein